MVVHANVAEKMPKFVDTQRLINVGIGGGVISSTAVVVVVVLIVVVIVVVLIVVVVIIIIVIVIKITIILTLFALSRLYQEQASRFICPTSKCHAM